MRTISKKIIVMLLLITASSIVYSQKKHQKEVTFTVAMDCESCKQKIEQHIAFEKGVKDMEVSVEKQQVYINYDSRKTNEDKLIEAFRKINYEAIISNSKKTDEKEK